MASTSTLTIKDARILTLAGSPGPRRADELRDLGVIERGFVHVAGGLIEAVGDGEPTAPGGEDVIDAGGCVLLPGFVDCHTHACWAGHRYDELEMKLAGASYLEILKAGGGIMATVRAVRAAAEEELTESLLRRLERMSALGTATVEVKSGYGLTTEDELKMLRAIHAAVPQAGPRLVATFLGAHAIDTENPKFVDQTIEETLPAVVTEFPRIPCDAYCEEGAWSVADTRRLLESAAELGCVVRVHADQFHSLGMTPLAVEMGARSIDHLEATTPDDIKRLAESDTIGVALPVCGLHLDDRYAPARALVDAGGALALATNYNPGSAPSPSMPLVMALAARKLRLTSAEAITAATINAACVLGLQDELGSIEPGKRADLQLLAARDERELAYELATAGPRLVVVGGKIIHRGPGDLGD